MIYRNDVRIPMRIDGGSRQTPGRYRSQLRQHRIVIWAKHGVMARPDVSVQRAAKCMEYAETAENYEYLNLAVGEIGEGLAWMKSSQSVKLSMESKNYFRRSIKCQRK